MILIAIIYLETMSRRCHARKRKSPRRLFLCVPHRVPPCTPQCLCSVSLRPPWRCPIAGPCRPRCHPTTASGICDRWISLQHVQKHVKHTFKNNWNTCKTPGKHLKTITNIYNIQIYFYNIQIKTFAAYVWYRWNIWNIHLKHTCITIAICATSQSIFATSI
jgi:hypothetical protein